jgi:hypothetical protein
VSEVPGGERQLDVRTHEVARAARDLLARRVRPFSRVTDPELRKNLERLYRAMDDAQRLPLDAAARSTLLGLLEAVDPAALNHDASGALMAAIDEVLIAAGDSRLLAQLLVAEYDRDRVDAGNPVVTWSDVFDDRIEASALADPATLELARLRLLALYRTRAMSYGLERTRSMARARRLLLLAPVLLALVAATIATLDILVSGVSWRGGLLAATAGALGATLSGAFKLRDQAPRVSDLRAFWYVFAAQPLVGAAAGLFLLVVLLSGIVSVADSGNAWATRAAVAFVAGFSEPFLLATVGRIAGERKES